MKLFRTLIVVFLLGAGAAEAAEYVVQIGAFRNPHADFGEAAAEIGVLSTRESPSGLTRFVVGSFATEAEAQQAMRRLRAAGYSDAFVRRTIADARAIEDLPAIEELPAVGAGPSERSRFESLPRELRARTVYLDGVLHVKEGDRFTPLDEYEGGRYRR